MEENTNEKIDNKKQIVIKWGTIVTASVLVGLVLRVRSINGQVATLNQMAANLSYSTDAIAEVVNNIVDVVNPDGLHRGLNLELVKVPTPVR